MNIHLSQTVLDKIKGENIKPKAKWYFIVKHAILWVPGVLVTILGAIAVAGGFYAFNHSGWEYREYIYTTQSDFFIETVPYIWIASYLLFSALIIKALRTTHKGYRFSIKYILLSSIVTSIVIGWLIYFIDDNFSMDTIIRYPVHQRENRVWLSPGEGRLAGIIVRKEETFLELKDNNGAIWDIDLSGFGTTTFPFVVEGKSIRIVGTSTNINDKDKDGDRHNFIACAVFPWEIGGFVRPPIPKAGLNRPPISPPHNKNPDCVSVLNDIRQHIRRGERNH